MKLEYQCVLCTKWYCYDHDDLVAHFATCSSKWIGVENADIKLKTERELLEEDAKEIPDADRSLARKNDVDPLQVGYRIEELRIEQLVDEDTNRHDNLFVEIVPVSKPIPAVVAPQTGGPKNKRNKWILLTSKENHKFSRSILKNLRDPSQHVDHQLQLQCDLCGNRFGTRIEVYKHMHRDHIDKTLTCNRCGRTFKRHTDLRAHLQQYPVDRCTCEQCGESFKNLANLGKHMRIHTGEMPYECGECGRKFRQNASLQTHRRRIHTKVRPHKCDRCGLDFTQPHNLRKHIDHTHLNLPIDKPHKCDTCGLVFRRGSELRKHARTHTGERPFACTFCERRFGRIDALRVHQNIHTGNAPYKCGHCERGFHSAAARRQHEKGVHNIA